MIAVFKRIVFLDEWIGGKSSAPGSGKPETSWLACIIPLPAPGTYEFQNYALGYRWTATEQEVRLLQTNGMLGHAALKLHDDFKPLTFADLLGPEFIPEINPSQAELLRVESRVREAAISWSHFIENLEGGD